MSQILIIERSATLKHLLQRTLKAGNIENTRTADTFEDGLWLLRDSADGNTDVRYSAVIVGTPTKDRRDFSNLLDYLQGGPILDLPLLLISHSDNPSCIDWVKSRPKSKLILWNDFSKIPGELRLCLQQTGDTDDKDNNTKPRNLKILFIDDSQSVRVTFNRLLVRSGFSVTLAASLNEARQQLEKELPDLCIIDYYLPDGHGDELCREISDNPKLSSIMTSVITGTYNESAIKDCLQAGAVECMFKNEAKELFLARVDGLARTIESQKAIKSERNRLDSILDSVGDGIFGVDTQGRVTFINPEALKLFNFTDETEIIGRSAHDYFHYADDEGIMVPIGDCPLQQCYENGKSISSLETCFWRQPKSPFPVECSLLPLNSDTGDQGSVVVFRDISERKSIEQLKWDVAHDPLTQLINGRQFEKVLGEHILSLAETGDHAALLYIDLDRLSYVNEAAGETSGDLVIADIANKLGSHLRGKDVIGRLESDKFGVLLCNIQMSNVFAVSDAFRREVSECTYEAYRTERQMTCSIGVSILSSETPSAEYALERARIGCRIAKDQGRNRTHIYVSEHDESLADQLQSGWASRLRDAIKNNLFDCVIQPIVKIDQLPLKKLSSTAAEYWRIAKSNDGTPTKYLFEVLLRMRDEQGNWIAPDIFIPIASRVNMSQEIDLWVVRQVLRKLVSLGAAQKRVAFTINLSRDTLQDPAALNIMLNLFDTPKIDPKSVIFEITETAAINNFDAAINFISKLRDIGCRFALDDFGSGFSSLSHLKQLPMDFVKIDSVFVEPMTSSDIDRKMVESINDIAHSMKLLTVAEQVTSRECVAALREIGVNYAQGYYLGKPMRLDKLKFNLT